MIQFALSLASIPQILVFAVLLAIAIATAFRSAFRHPVGRVAWAVTAGDWTGCCDRDARCLIPGEVIPLRTRLTLPVMLFLSRVRLAIRGAGLAGIVIVVALLAALGLHVIVGTATALLTPQVQARGIERSA